MMRRIIRPRGRLLPGLLVAGLLLSFPSGRAAGAPPWSAALNASPRERIRAFQTAIRGGAPGTPEGVLRLAVGADFRTLGQKEDALREWSHPSVAASPLAEYGLLWRARLLESSARKSEAVPLWKELFAAGGEPSFRSDAAEALAKEAEGRGAPAEALPYLEALRSTRGEEGELLARLARAYTAAGREERAREVAALLWRDHPANPKTVALFKDIPALEAPASSREEGAVLARLRSLAKSEAWWRLERELPAFRPSSGEAMAWAKVLEGLLEEGKKLYSAAHRTLQGAVDGPAGSAGEAMVALARILPEVSAGDAAYESLEARMAKYDGPERDAVTAAQVRLMKLHFRADEEERAQIVALDILARDGSQEDALEILYKRAWKAWMNGDRPAALTLFRTLAEKAPAEGEYWLASKYSMERLGFLPKGEGHRVRQELERASRYGYFGYRVRQRPPGEAGPVREPFPERAAAAPGSHRLKGDLLASVGLWDEARQEYGMGGALKGDRALCWDIARMESARGEERRAIFYARKAFPGADGTAGGTLPDAVWRVLYPRPFSQEIRQAASSRDLPFHLLCALIRQESGFDEGARSRSDALGLTQLLPTTGRATARKHKYPAPKRGTFFEPEWNVKVGAAYFADQTQKFGAVHFALAAYNAGPNRVSAWKARPGCPQDPDLFTESIPFRETRGYVRRILAGYWEYDRLYPAEAEPPPAALAASLTP